MNDNLGLFVRGIFVSYSAYQTRARPDRPSSIRYRAFVSVGDSIIQMTSSVDVFKDFVLGEEVTIPLRVSDFNGTIYYNVPDKVV